MVGITHREQRVSVLNNRYVSSYHIVSLLRARLLLDIGRAAEDAPPVDWVVMRLFMLPLDPLVIRSIR